MTERCVGVLNPNASDRITAQIAKRVGHLSLPVAAQFITNHHAPTVIESARDLANAEATIVDALAPFDYAAVVVAGFVDPGITALRRRCRCPVVGMGSMALAAASAYGPFGIITVGVPLEPLIADFVAACGYSTQCVGINSIDVGVLGAVDSGVDSEVLAQRLATLVDRGAGAICLGSGSLACAADNWQSCTDAPLIDGISAAVRFAAALAAAQI